MRVRAALALVAVSLAAGCDPAGVAPDHPTWSDVAPILRGQCVSCHGWTASDRPPDLAGVHPENTGGSLRLDFFDATPEICGEATLALDPHVALGGSPLATSQIARDVSAEPGARFPRMPPQPAPALPSWQVETLRLWAANPVKGPPPPGNRPPDVTVSRLPSTADGQLAFTAVIGDADGDAAIGLIEAGGAAFLMNRAGSFAVRFDASAWPAGVLHPRAVLCDGWSKAIIDLGPVEIRH